MIPIAKPSLSEEEVSAAQKVILSGWVTQGPKVKAFENAFAHKVGSRFACAVSNCTTALHLALLAVGVKPGDVVITVSHSFIATANVVRHCGAEPIFIDINSTTYSMDVEELLRVINEDCVHKNGSLYYKHFKRIAVGESPLKYFNKVIDNKTHNFGKVAAILPVHQMGMPCEIAKIVEIAKENNIPVVEDAACAIGSEISSNDGATWEKIGRPHGDIACFSFHPRKVLTTGDGGMLTTNNREFDDKCKLLRQHGMSVPDTVRHESQKVIFEDYVATGFNYRMTDIQAAIGIEQLKKLDGILIERCKLAAKYEELLENISKLELPKMANNIRTNWQSYPVKILEGAKCSQLELMQFLLNKGIATRRGIMNAHQESPYIDAHWLLSKSEFARDNVVLLPLFSGMTTQNLNYVANALNEIIL